MIICFLTGCTVNAAAGSQEKSVHIDNTDVNETESAVTYEPVSQAEETSSADMTSKADEADVTSKKDPTDETTEAVSAKEPESEMPSVSYGVHSVPKELVMEAVSLWDPAGDNDYYIMPESNSRLLLRKELAGFSKSKINLIRNEILARHGWDFDDPVLRAYFYTQKWYTPNYGQNDSVSLNETENANLALLDKLESESAAEEEKDLSLLNELVELEPDKDCPVTIGNSEQILKICTERRESYTADGPGSWFLFTDPSVIVDLLDPKTWSRWISYTVRIKYNGQEIFTDLCGLSGAYLLNLQDKSFLLLSGGTGENDHKCVEEFLITDNGITKKADYGGEVCSVTDKGFFTYLHYFDTGVRCIYCYYSVTDEGIKKNGSSVFNRDELKLVEPAACYTKDENGITMHPLKKGDTVIIDSLDSRDYLSSLNAYMITVILPTGERACIPVFYNDALFDYTESGVSWSSLFDQSQLIWNGLY